MGTLSLGFAVSALAIFAVVSRPGQPLFGWLHRTPAPSLVPPAALVLAVPAHPWSPEHLQEPVWLQYRIMALEPAMRRVALLALLAGAATAGALTVWGMA